MGIVFYLVVTTKIFLSELTFLYLDYPILITASLFFERRIYDLHRNTFMVQHIIVKTKRRNSRYSETFSSLLCIMQYTSVHEKTLYRGIKVHKDCRIINQSIFDCK